jgi:hypothetical protein
MILPRSDFAQTMTDSEKSIMKAHGDFRAWPKLVRSFVTVL